MAVGEVGSLVSAEVGCDLRPMVAARAVNWFVKEANEIRDGGDITVRLVEYVDCLEEERRKIEAFKRELPLCLVLLNDVIDGLKKEVMQSKSGPVLEQFIPTKKQEKDSGNKMKWMDLNMDLNMEPKSKSDSGTEKNMKEKVQEPPLRSMSIDLFGPPFNGLPVVPVTPLPDLTLLTPGIKEFANTISDLPEEHSSFVSHLKVKTPMPSLSNGRSDLHGEPQQNQLHAPRKARRCWSAELHRRFVNALQQLGGSQATPKQIRELMKVDGLTNDEVKSHLQKYRLHSKRQTSSSAPTSTPAVTLGELWASSSDGYPVSKASTSPSGSPQGHLQLAGTAVTCCDSYEDHRKAKGLSWRGLNQGLGKELTV